MTTTTHGTVDYYRDRLSAWSGTADRFAAALGMIQGAVEAGLPEPEALAQVRNVIDALDQVRSDPDGVLAEFDRNRAR